MCFPWMGKCSKQHFGVPNVRLILWIERSCKSRIIIQIDKSLSKAAVDNCVKQYHSDLLLRHQELCPWYNIHGSENLTNPLLLPRSQLLTDFESRLASFETSSVLLFMDLLVWRIGYRSGYRSCRSRYIWRFVFIYRSLYARNGCFRNRKPGIARPHHYSYSTRIIRMGTI